MRGAFPGRWHASLNSFSLIAGQAELLYFGFKGGKGVSVAATIAAFIDWRVLVISLLVFIIFVLITRIVSISSW